MAWKLDDDRYRRLLYGGMGAIGENTNFVDGWGSRVDYLVDGGGTVGGYIEAGGIYATSWTEDQSEDDIRAFEESVYW